MSPAFPLVRVCGREVGEAKILERIINVLKLIMTLAGRGICDESLRITADLLELIVGCTAGCQLITSGGWIFQKVVSYIFSNPGVIMTGIVGFYDLTVTVDLLP